MKKIIISFVIVVISIVSIYSLIYGVNAANFNFDISSHDSVNESEFNKSINTFVGIALSCVRYVGAGIALISIVMIAMKYLYSSPGEKADYKKNLLVYVIGGIGMFSVGTILQIIQNLSATISGGAPASS